MNNVYFLDLVLFMFLLQYVFNFNFSSASILFVLFLKSLNEVFSYSLQLILSSIISVYCFIFLLLTCYGGYFSYSFSPCGMIEFTFFLSFITWLSTFLCFVSSEKVSVYFSKGGDLYLKTLSMLLIEVVSEFSRPIALTVRLTVNITVGHMISMSLFLLVESTSGMFAMISLAAIMMECFVFIIQSYIFSRLIFLYLNE